MSQSSTYYYSTLLEKFAFPGWRGEFNTHLPAGGLNNCVSKQHWAFEMRPHWHTAFPTPIYKLVLQQLPGRKAHIELWEQRKEFWNQVFLGIHLEDSTDKTRDGEAHGQGLHSRYFSIASGMPGGSITLANKSTTNK